VFDLTKKAGGEVANWQEIAWIVEPCSNSLGRTASTASHP